MVSNNKKGFTLIELLVVIAIIGLLSTIVMVSLNTARMKARDTKRKGELKQIATALEMYYDAYGRYPPFRPSNSCGGTRSDWATSYCSLANWLTTDDDFLKFLSTVPKDPLNKLVDGDTPWWDSFTYTYGVSTDGQIYDLLTSLETPGDKDRCEFRIWVSQAVWPGDTGCWGSGVAARNDQIYSVK